MPRSTRRHRAAARALFRAAAVLLLATGCSRPPMEPLTDAALGTAERRWEAHGADGYHLVVRVRAPRVAPAVYDLVVEGGQVTRIRRDDGRAVPPEAARDYSIAGLFRLLRSDLRLADVPHVGDVPPIDLRARFEAETGRLVRYRRTVGTARRRVLLIEVLEYEPQGDGEVRGAAGRVPGPPESGLDRLHAAADLG